ncbi:hypothetical protein TNCV_3502831 [Trichonephila clavipes]|uniref:Uncharacterized protein n=1 Tax=Trichonephila clavipes TaxID=2585209 RepID=A0A8X6RV64_TRICX|nr:hypothetical protein TNCV_3502831 [Trichonephila clavipes]
MDRIMKKFIIDGKEMHSEFFVTGESVVYLISVQMKRPILFHVFSRTFMGSIPYSLLPFFDRNESDKFPNVDAGNYQELDFLRQNMRARKISGIREGNLKSRLASFRENALPPRDVIDFIKS